MFSILKCVYVVVLLSFQMKISMNIYIYEDNASLKLQV